MSKNAMKELYKEFDHDYRSMASCDYEDHIRLDLSVKLNCYYQSGKITVLQAVALADAFGLDYPWFGDDEEVAV